MVVLKPYLLSQKAVAGPAMLPPEMRTFLPAPTARDIVKARLVYYWELSAGWWELKPIKSLEGRMKTGKWLKRIKRHSPCYELTFL